jgi:hypothetical protein
VFFLPARPFNEEGAHSPFDEPAHFPPDEGLERCATQPVKEPGKPGAPPQRFAHFGLQDGPFVAAEGELFFSKGVMDGLCGKPTVPQGNADAFTEQGIRTGRIAYQQDTRRGENAPGIEPAEGVSFQFVIGQMQSVPPEFLVQSKAQWNAGFER